MQSTVKPSGADLALSLIFAVAQIGVGGVVVWEVWRRRIWLQAKFMVLAALAIWFIGSGVTELVVSGSEAVLVNDHQLSAAGFAVLHVRADMALFGFTIVVAIATVGGIAYMRVRQWKSSVTSKR